MTNINKTLIARAVCVALAMAGAVAASAQEPTGASLDVTIRLLPENAVGPGEITRRIELPPSAANTTPPRAPAADEAPPENRGQEISSEARERGREFGQETAEHARENRENAGRPDNPGRPDDAGPPLEPPSSPPGSPPGPPITPPGRP